MHDAAVAGDAWSVSGASCTWAQSRTNLARPTVAAQHTSRSRLEMRPIDWSLVVAKAKPYRHLNAYRKHQPYYAPCRAKHAEIAAGYAQGQLSISRVHVLSNRLASPHPGMLQHSDGDCNVGEGTLSATMCIHLVQRFLDYIKDSLNSNFSSHGWRLHFAIRHSLYSSAQARLISWVRLLTAARSLSMSLTVSSVDLQDAYLKQPVVWRASYQGQHWKRRSFTVSRLTSA